MKFPWMQWFVSDWLTDPQVSICEPATRGILMDWICNMQLLDRSGSITGKRDILARLGRCTIVQVDAALQDLNTTQAADVTFRNDVVTVTNRRMKREYLARKNGAIRVQRHRSNVACNGLVTPHKPEPEPEPEGERQMRDVPTPQKTPSPDRPPFENLKGWQLRKDLRETTDPAERLAINAELKRRANAGKPPVTPRPTPTKPPMQPASDEKLKAMAAQVAEQRRAIL